MTNNKLIAVAYYPDSNPRKLLTIVTDRTGVRREILTTILSNNLIIDENWWPAVEGEIEFQIGEDLKRKSGTNIPDNW